MNNELIEAAKAVLARWDSIDWKVAPGTAEGMNRLRAALSAEPEPCCGEYATCLRACTPRGRWLQFQSTATLPEVEEWIARHTELTIEPWETPITCERAVVSVSHLKPYIATLTAAHAAELADLRQQVRDSKDWERNTAEENVRLVGVIARKNGAEELAEAKGRRDALHVLTSLKTGGCFCAIGIGHPGMTSHSPQCIAATTFSESARAQQEKTK